MKIAAVQTSIDCFHGRVQNFAATKHAQILAVMELGVDYTCGELCAATGMTPNVMSPRLSELRAKNLIVRTGARRVCPHTHISVFVHRKVGPQLELL